MCGNSKQKKTAGTNQHRRSSKINCRKSPYAISFTFSTLRPRYVPQDGQATCDGTAALQSGQVFRPGAFQRFDIARIFCLLREERLLGTAMG
jgi:hypothetical protein